MRKEQKLPREQSKEIIDNEAIFNSKMHMREISLASAQLLGGSTTADDLVTDAKIFLAFLEGGQEG